MNILSQNYNNLLKNMIFEVFSNNLKELYLNNFNSNTTLTINKEFLNFNIFDKYNNYNLYSNKIYNPAF